MTKMLKMWKVRTAAKEAESPDALKAPSAETSVTIESPQPDEQVGPRGFSFRVSAPSASKVEVSLDNGPWLACQFIWGSWRLDAASLAPGVHRVQAQAHLPGRRIAVSRSREFKA